MAKSRYSAAGGVIIDAGRLLLLDRPSRGEVRLPKGHIEPGEDAEETALREVAEESGYCDLTVVADLGSHTIEFEYEGAAVVRHEHYFLLALAGDRQLQRSKSDAAQFAPIWVAAEQAVDLLTYAAEQDAARRAVAAYQAAAAQK